MTVHFKQVTIVGVGLLGASFGMILKRRGLADRVVGVGRSPDNLKVAAQRGAIDAFEQDSATAVAGAELILLATPVDSYAAHLTAWKRVLKPGAIVSDVGSVKGALVARMEALLPGGVHFVGAHPVAGGETSGAGAAAPDLFAGALCLLTPTPNTDAGALETVRRVWDAAGAVVRVMDPFVHDRILGAVSHLPHVAAFALVNALTDLQAQTAEDGTLLDYAGSGWRDTTRIAASSPEMWRDICLENRDNLLRMIDALERRLQRFRGLIDDRDGAELEREITKARDARRTMTTAHDARRRLP